MSICNAWGVLSHLPPNSHAENLRQIFILRPVSSLIQSKWMQQQTNLSSPTSKQLCSLSLWLKDTDIAERRSAGGEKEVLVKGTEGIMGCAESNLLASERPSARKSFSHNNTNSKTVWSRTANYCSKGLRCFPTQAVCFFTWPDCSSTLTAAGFVCIFAI